jgi:hypothetical protein
MFIAVVSINGSHAVLMPDLSAAVDITVEKLDHVLLVPRAAVAIDRTGATVEVRGAGRSGRQSVTLGAASSDAAVIAKGLDEGTIVAVGSGGKAP